MRNPTEFDSFYVESRDRLLLEAYALTGDAAAARSAVRSSFASAWHHWRKVSRLADRDSWVRTLAWNRARHSPSSLLHRISVHDGANAATIAALRSLPLRQRKALLLSQLTPLSMAEISRELGTPQPETERELASATHSFVMSRDTQAVLLPRHFHELREDLNQAVGAEPWPDPAEVRAVGARRRTIYTLAGVGLASVGLLATGLLVADSEVAAASLTEGRLTEHRALRIEPTPPAPAVTEEGLLGEAEIARVAPALSWREVATDPNLAGNGLVLPCQQARFADPDGSAALVRSFEGSSTTEVTGKNKGGKATGKSQVKSQGQTKVTGQAWEMTELSADSDSAATAFEAATGWYAGCTQPRTTLLTTHKVMSVGDEARVFTYQDWRSGDSRQISVALARTGDLVVTTAASLPASPTSSKGVLRALTAAVNRFCGEPGAGACAGPATPQSVPVLAVGEFPGLLNELDLPPIPVSRGPWVGAPPKPATTPVTTLTNCDRMDFSAKQVRRGVTRTYLFSENSKALEFGLNQTAGLASPAKASALVDGLARQMGDCAQKNLAVSVHKLTDNSSKTSDELSWRVDVEISDSRSVSYFVGVVRNRSALSELTFVPSGEMKMSEADFNRLLERAGERLRYLPKQS